MDKVTYFKNFAMGTEIDIAGTFIHQGIKEFNRLRSFHYESEIFHVLYPISVGIERLQKALIVLLEDISLDQIESFEKSLITHSHQELHARILKWCDIKFNSHQYRFLQVITNFYNSCRYDRFNISNDYAKERDLLTDFISTSLEIDINISNLFPTNNNDRIKDFFGRVIGSISRKYYEQIKEQAFKQNIYTYELRSGSPAEKIFLPQFTRDSLQEQYVNEQISFKEFIVFLMNAKTTSAYYEFIKSIEPLNIEIAFVQDYLACICEGEVPQSLINEVEALYEHEIEDIKERINVMNVIGDEGIIFFEDMYEDEEVED
ncbi:hypothetical protein [Desulfosporosinus sp. HMP52]|uniref:hypothetical protein n=1 Tax=Desulfosporosinus sp. HMP52 TaxID=1487923 RepID=UPI00068DC7EC|nr:hypothetical protein [Desulfosporosinus sp. HMP52]